MIDRTTLVRDQAINIRISRRQRDTIDQAAQALGKSRSEFILDAAFTEAEAVLLDQVYFRLDDDSFAEFNMLLDTPPPPSAQLKSLFQKPAPWE